MAALATVPSQPDVNPGEYYDIKEAAKKLRCGERWLRDGCNHNGFPHSRTGKSIVFNGPDLAEIYARFRTPGYTVRRPAPRRRRTA